MFETIPDPPTKANGDPIIYGCSYCGAINIGTPPHGFKEPCPHAISLLEAKERESVGSAFMMNDMTKFMKKMGVINEDDE